MAAAAPAKRTRCTTCALRSKKQASQADLDLDDYMVFDNDAEKSKEFFRALLFRHVVALMEEERTTPPSSPMELQKLAFTQRNAIDDFVRSAEGVPRDAISILRLAAQRADDDPIAVEHIRGAARRWYLQNKEKEVPDEAKALLHWIIDEVIDRPRARAFLLEQGDGNDPLISRRQRQAPPRRQRHDDLGLTRDELEQLLQAAKADGPRSAGLITLLAYNSLRVDEALSRDVEHLGHQQGHRAARIPTNRKRPAERRYGRRRQHRAWKTSSESNGSRDLRRSSAETRSSRSALSARSRRPSARASGAGTERASVRRGCERPRRATRLRWQ
jgi:hypothetical protein